MTQTTVQEKQSNTESICRTSHGTDESELLNLAEDWLEKLAAFFDKHI